MPARLGGSEIDYVALARRLRDVHRRKAERIDGELPARETDPSLLSLDRALDALQGEGAQSLLDEVGTQLRRAVADKAHVPAPRYSVGAFPVPLEDKFLDGVLDYYRHGWDTALDRRRMAQAVVTALANAAGDDGFVRADEASRRLGPLGVQLVARLRGLVETTTPVAGDASHKNTGKYLGLDPRVAGKIALSRRRPSYLERMPVVHELLRMLPKGALRGAGLASVQHLFPSAAALYQSLFTLGLAPQDTQVGGKFYSANVNALASMEAGGLRVHMSATDPDDHLYADAEVAVKEMARTELATLFHGVDPARHQGRFLLLDDGGKLIRALHEHFPRFAHLCVAVEQTTRGIQVLEEMQHAGTKILCPVVNMAQSELKRSVESPLIAESVAWHTDRYLESLGLAELRPTPEHPKTAVVVGFGATGSALAAALRRRGYHVVVTDKDETKLVAARAAGFDAAPRADAFRQADLLVGATGMGALEPEDWRLLKSGAVLANAASGTHELGLRGLDYRALTKLDRQQACDASGAMSTQFAGKRIVVGREGDDWRLQHRVLRVAGEDGKERELLFLRGGSVVNMEHDLPPEYRQIIVAMLIASCAQAMRERTPGPHDLDGEVQTFLRARFAAALAAEGLSLTEPNLDAVRGPWG
ncbi:MAG: NAD-binding protein [Deltaproteobacteria bacterium]|nr:NAD-binding protein [Deltaproteobacteria bacterium]